MIVSPRILVVDDDPDTRSNLSDILELDGYETDTAGSVAEALRREDWARYAAILLDRKLPDGSAEQLLPRIKRLAPTAAIMIVTGYSDLDGAIAAIRMGAADYLVKPINADLIRTRLAGVMERKRAEEEITRLNRDLQARVNELQALLDVIPIGIAIAQDPQCREIRANAFFKRLLEVPPEANVSLNGPAQELPAYRAFRQGRELASDELPLQYAAAHGVEIHDTDFDIVLPGGETINVLAHAAPLFDELSRPRGAVAAFVNNTERMRAQERALQTERLAAIGQMMTGLAHESGNALARSQACLEMLAFEVEDKPEALDLINRIQRAQNHLRQLYEEVRGYAAPVKLECERWDISHIWRQAWDHLALQRQAKKAVLDEEKDGIDLFLCLDHFRIEQVFRNIFDNALAACAEPVRIQVSCAETTLDDRPALQIAVRDNGPGLSVEQKKRIFEPFFTTKTKGTGLGMAIAKRIVEAHGGRIAVGSPPRGAEIIVTLPRDPP